MITEEKNRRLQALIDEAFELSKYNPAFILWREKIIDYHIEASQQDNRHNNPLTK